MSSTHAMNPRMVGERVALLATAKGLGLPVADGLSVTFHGFEVMDTWLRFRRAMPYIRGPVRISLTDRSLRPDVGEGSWHGNATTWEDLGEGLDEIMARDRTENPRRQGRKRGVVVQRVPLNCQSAVLDADWDRAPTLCAISGDFTPSRTACNKLRRLAHLTLTRLVRPVILEVLLVPDGGVLITDLQTSAMQPTGHSAIHGNS
jgi:hypothetical protein